MNYKIALTYGDPSTDGHGMKETVHYLTNQPLAKITRAVTETNSHLPFNFDDLCEDYGDCCISEDQYRSIKDLGIPVDQCVDDYDDDEYFMHSFPELYLEFAKHSIPTLEWAQATLDFEEEDIGGYGLFEL